MVELKRTPNTEAEEQCRGDASKETSIRTKNRHSAAVVAHSHVGVRSVVGAQTLLNDAHRCAHAFERRAS